MIAGRLEKAKIEFREIPTYDYLVINDKVSNAVEGNRGHPGGQ